MDILVTGASGAIGGSLTERLVRDGEHPVVASRDPRKLRRRFPDLRAVRIDVRDHESLAPALAGIDVAYYLVHSMEPGTQAFAQADRDAARAFGAAAKRAGIDRVIYLGGLGPPGAALSEHLESRQETGRELAAAGPSVLEFRAAMVIGRQSASYRMMTDLVRRLPAMVLPRWVRTPSQPIAIDDVLDYLAAGRSVDLPDHHTVVDIGGADVLAYRDMLKSVADRDGKHRVMVEVPFLSPRLSSIWCGVTTSVSTAVARPLVEGMTVPLVVTGDAAVTMFPDIRPMGFEDALRRAEAGA
ncbi:MAG: NAD(P)H-binding protein [Actinomycetota bacterium]